MQEREVWAEILGFGVWEANSGPLYSFVKISKEINTLHCIQKSWKNQIHVIYLHHTSIK